jgi:hypothetical protein
MYAFPAILAAVRVLCERVVLQTLRGSRQLRGYRAVSVGGWAAVLAIMFSAGLGCGGAGETCEVAGRTFERGARWTCDDGCNFCSCEGTGHTSTTLIACSQPPGPAANKLICDDHGAVHIHGDTWTCGNCNTCSCSDGKITRKTGCSSDDAGS